MGMRGAAARLGLGIATAIARDLKKQRHWNMKKISRSSCSAAVTEEEKKKGGTGLDEDGKSLYLFFSEQTGRQYGDGRSVCRMRYPIRSTKLSYLLSPSSSSTKLIEAVPILSCSDRYRIWGFGPCSNFIFTDGGAVDVGGRVGAKFTRSYGKSPYQDRSDEICSFGTQGPEEDHHRNPKLKNFKVLKKGEEEFLFLDSLPDGKVYCLCPRKYIKNSEIFQVLDTTRKGKGSKKWLPLEPPPTPKKGSYRCFTGVIAGTKFLVWYPLFEGVYCFDVTQPEKGWSPTSPSLGSCIPFLNCNHPLVVEHEHHGNFLMFTFDPHAHYTVQVLLMSQKYDTLQALNQPLVLPELPWNIDDGRSTLDYQFVHLGPQKMCLVVHQFFYPLLRVLPPHLSGAKLEKFAYDGRNMGYVLVITFEYEIINLDIQYRLLTTRHFEYTSKRANRRLFTRTRVARLAGAAVL